MALKFSQVRSEIASKVGSLPGFQQTKHSPDFFGRTENTVANLAFGVKLASSTAMEERQRRSVGVYVSTPVQVIFSYRLRPLDIYPTDYDLSMDTEQEVIQKVLEAYAANNEFTIRYQGSTRNVTESQEYVIITLEFIALHTIQ
jgi:hypothetical protein|tara:strand:- start:11898 stop:12329 length:432 start_codon:yes stop_codon:yes gene_type:complete